MSLLENKTILIIGLGLIGGSIARGLAHAVPGIRILAHGRDETALQSALIDGSIHACSTNLETMAPQADLIILCTPTLTVRPILEQLRNLIGPDVIITDAASVKGNVVKDARRLYADSLHRFVPGHPIAGSEQSGYKASRADLFRNRKVILTPLAENSSQAVRTVMQLWQTLGADVHGMTPERHDEVLAGTSHLPHLLAFTLVNTLVDSVSERDRAQQVFDYAAGGFADFSRIASSDPYMWRDIFLANCDATVDVLDAYVSSLGEMRKRLLQGDGDGMQSEFARAKRVRDEFIRRFRPSGTMAQDLTTSGFTIDPEYIAVRPGSSLSGFYRPPANLTVACKALEKSANSSGVSRIEGFPESIAALAAIHDLRATGVPVVGPEDGVVWVYGEQPSGNHAETGQSLTVALPADPFLVGLMVLGATILPESIIQLQAVTEPHQSGSVLECLQKLGANIELIDTDEGEGQEIVCRSSVLSGARLDLSGTQLPDDQLLTIFAAAALAVGETSIVINADRAQNLIRDASELIDWAAGTDFENGVLVIRPVPLQAAELNLSSNIVSCLIAIVMAQKVQGQLIVTQPGELAENYPGLLHLMAEMGFGLNFNIN
ncbi:MAG: prephenate dehydrogenase/arogenate dehydrogenase family protein [Pseudohongiella sp.]|nr:prephenate dehydrogenase/arogenate dehydrogenase family protein [Pseudohongiella sp.]